MQMERADQMEIFRTKRTTSSEVLHFFRSNRLEGKLPFRLYKISISTAQAVKRQLEMMLMIYRVSSAFSSNIKFRKFTETLAELLASRKRGCTFCLNIFILTKTKVLGFHDVTKIRRDFMKVQFEFLIRTDRHFFTETAPLYS